MISAKIDRNDGLHLQDGHQSSSQSRWEQIACAMATARFCALIMDKRCCSVLSFTYCA